MLSYLLISLAAIPVVGFVLSLLIPRVKERLLFTVAMTTVALEAIVFIALATLWTISGAEPMTVNIGTIYDSGHYTFDFKLYLDILSAVFMGVAVLITAVVFRFSKFYMHREQGFKRFYYTVLLFFLGLTYIVLAGNFEVLLVGWECIGISSVLLIAFYRDRFLPARNALKVFSVYRIADAFLLAAIWYAHHVFGRSVNFSELTTAAAQHGGELAILGLLLLVVAAIKSAQYPFSYWLPRAIEGPTSSSAIFYGALSVHMGLFLLLRSYPLWEGALWLHIATGIVGIITAIIATSIAKVQSSIKSQIAYSSIAQIGIMFVEVALGLWWLALIHFIGNALLRTYQLLVSPSIVGYLIRDQFFHFVTPPQRINGTLIGKIRATTYVLSIKEWNMNTAANRYVWKPLKSIGRVLRLLDRAVAQLGVLLVLTAGSTVVMTHPGDRTIGIALAAAIISIILYIRAYTTKGEAQNCWNLIMLGSLFGVLFLAALTGADAQYVLIYVTGISVAYVAGHLCIYQLRQKGETTKLRYYRGAMFAHKKLGHTFFIISLLLMAFPLSPAFLAQETLLSDIPMQQAYFVVFFCLSYLLLGISIMRLYTKLFFGPHEANHHEKAYRSS